MSAPESPADERLSSSQSSIHPALHPSVTNVPVTPGSFTEVKTEEPESLSEKPLQADDGPQWNAKSYFAPKDGEERSSSPTEMAAGARSGDELLRRLSLPGQSGPGQSQHDIDPMAAHPNLGLSGGIISATICMPYDIGFVPGGEWVNSAIPFLSFALTEIRISNLDVAHRRFSTPSPILPLHPPHGTIHSLAGLERSDNYLRLL